MTVPMTVPTEPPPVRRSIEVGIDFEETIERRASGAAARRLEAASAS